LDDAGAFERLPADVAAEELAAASAPVVRLLRCQLNAVAFS
jgi:hypothetical protein